MQPFLMIIYLLLCVLVGYAGRDRRFGFWGSLALSLVLTPFITFIMMMLLERTGKRIEH